MNKLATIVGAVAMAAVLGVSAQAEHKDGHFKGIFEAPMMDAAGVVEGSEGKIGQFGQYKVEVAVAPLETDADYKLCLRAAPSLGGAGADTFLQAVTVLAGDDELKATGDLAAGNLWRPAFRVFAGGGAEACDGDLVYESGTAVTDEVI
jgi:hypothetical protein